MATNNLKVLFYFISQYEYNKRLANNEILDNALYFISDDGNELIYKGTDLYSYPTKIVNSLPEVGSPKILYICKNESNEYNLYYWVVEGAGGKFVNLSSQSNTNIDNIDLNNLLSTDQDNLLKLGSDGKLLVDGPVAWKTL